MHDNQHEGGKIMSDAPVYFEDNEISLRLLLKHVLEKWKLILLGALVMAVLAAAGGLAFRSGRETAPVYTSETRLFLAPRLNIMTNIPDVPSTYALTNVYALVFTSQPVIDEAANRLGLAPGTFRKNMVKSTSANNTNVINITVTASSPEETFAMINALVDAGRDYITNVLDGEKLEVLEPANLPAPHVKVESTGSKISTGLQWGIRGGIIGGFLLVLLLVLLFFMDDKIRDKQTIEKMNLRVLASVPSQKTADKSWALERGPEPGRVPGDAIKPGYPDNAFGESINTICVGLTMATPAANILLVTSPLHREGKSFIVSSIAETLANMGKKVCVVDANLRSPELTARYLASNPGARKTGLADYLQGQAKESDILGQTEISNLFFIPAGDRHTAPIALLESGAFLALMNHLRSSFDFVLIDSPAVGSVSDALVLARGCDYTAMVIKDGNTPRAELFGAKSQLIQTGKPILGVVRNMAK